jgi:hypothetical protein
MVRPKDLFSHCSAVWNIDFSVVAEYTCGVRCLHGGATVPRLPFLALHEGVNLLRRRDYL